jgi:capsular polysaccharide export protein
MDGEGIYYDSGRASGLETLLSETTFDEELLARADRLRRRIVAAELTKYNVGAGSWQRPAHVCAPVILVPGQVESDASIRRGGALVRTNLDLLRAVRDDNPCAYLLYKPHPDVAAGLRPRGVGEKRALEYCDAIVRDVSMAQLLAVVDEVHLLTSLTGFEALLRGRRVVTYGQPFYAGWGLTEDKAPPPRRRRKMTLEELVAGALILYPTYVSRTTGAFTTPECALEELLLWREHRAPAVPLWRRVWRLLLRTGVVRR